MNTLSIVLLANGQDTTAVATAAAPMAARFEPGAQVAGAIYLGAPARTGAIIGTH